MPSAERSWFLAVTVLVSVGLAVAATLVASAFVQDTLDWKDRLRAVVTSLVVGLFVALILLARRGEFEVEDVEMGGDEADEEGFVTESVEPELVPETK